MGQSARENRVALREGLEAMQRVSHPHCRGPRFPDKGIKIPQAMWHGQKKKNKQIEDIKTVIITIVIHSKSYIPTGKILKRSKSNF